MRGLTMLPAERGQGLEGTLGFLERCTLASSSAITIGNSSPFCDTSGTKSFTRARRPLVSGYLDAEWTASLPASAKTRWIAVAGRPYQVGGAAGRLLLEAPELTAALAITKQMAVEVSGHLNRVLVDRDWADLVADDYDVSVRQLTRRSTVLRELRSFARREYGPARPTDASLKAAIASRGLA